MKIKERFASVHPGVEGPGSAQDRAGQTRGRLATPSLNTVMVLAALALAGQMARAEEDALQKLQMKADRFARKVLEETSVKKTIRAFKEVAQKRAGIPEVYYDKVVTLARDYLETSEEGPFSGSARMLLCGTESCKTAAEALEERLAQGHDKGQVYPVGGDVSIPRRLSTPQPRFTTIARAARVQGAVTLKAIIDDEGGVTVVEILKGLPMGLTEMAVATVEQWKFKPAVREGEPVAVDYTLAMNFRLGGFGF